MTNDISHPSNRSPFDRIRRVRADGAEYWSARDLQPLMGYAEWRNLQTAIDRARAAIRNTHGENAVTSHVVDATTLVPRPQGGSIKKEDFELSRYAAYLTAINGDPEKPETAAAQAYFAVRTREAETRPAFDPTSLSRLDILQLALNAEEELQAEKAKNAELEPKAEAYESFLDATGKFSVGAVAKMLGTSQNKLFRELRNAGVLIGKGAMRNTPYQKYMHHFEVKAHEYERSNGEIGCSYTTYVQPSGIDFIRRKLGLPSIDPLPGVGDPLAVRPDPASGSESGPDTGDAGGPAPPSHTTSEKGSSLMDDQAVTDLLDRIHARREREQVPPLSPALAHRIAEVLAKGSRE